MDGGPTMVQSETLQSLALLETLQIGVVPSCNVDMNEGGNIVHEKAPHEEFGQHLRAGYAEACEFAGISADQAKPCESLIGRCLGADQFTHVL